MPPLTASIRRFLLSFSLFVNLFAPVSFAQQTPSATPQQPALEPNNEEVVRVNSELVQSDVMVVDKQGKFVDHLQREQFELKVDGRPQDISFFERVTAGSVDEDAQLAAARGGRETKAIKTNAVKPLDRGRTIVFFIDDLHLSAESFTRTRKMLLRFIETQIGQNDQALIASASPQVGFLQQLTSDKTVLRAAVARLSSREVALRDFERPRMEVSQAVMIERNEPGILSYFIDQTLKENPVFGTGDNARRDAEIHVRQRASQMLQYAMNVAQQTLNSLRFLVGTSAHFPGRKLFYFISDGFVLENNHSNVFDQLRRVADAAVRADVVIYSLDARGLSTEMAGMPDASSDASPDLSGRLSSGSLNEQTARQEPLFSLAADTGGRALINTNALGDAITKVLKETSVYYLLAWKPESESNHEKFRRIEVSVKGRPDLTVMVKRGFYDTPPTETVKRPQEKGKQSTTKVPVPSASTPDEAHTRDLLSALTAPYPRSALPTSLSANYVNVENEGTLLSTSVQIDIEPSQPDADKGLPKEHVEVLGAVYDDHGKVLSKFQKTLTISPLTKDAVPPAFHRIVFTQQTKITPGLYQVRVAARDPKNGRTGSAMQWVEVPDLQSGQLTLSSLFVGERLNNLQTDNTEQATLPILNPDRHFSRTSYLRLILYIYNAANGHNNSSAASPNNIQSNSSTSGNNAVSQDHASSLSAQMATAQTTTKSAAPDVAIQIQVFRDDQPVITTPLRKVNIDGLADLTRIPYAAEIALNDLPAGLYILQVSAIDRTAKKSTAQRVKFVID